MGSVHTVLKGMTCGCSGTLAVCGLQAFCTNQQRHFVLLNLHQRCKYSDLPLARIQYFYTAGFRKGFEGVDHVGHTDEIKEGRRFESKSTKMRVCTFQMSGKTTEFRRRRPAGAKQVLFNPFLTQALYDGSPKLKNAGLGAGSRHLLYSKS